jgi:hypothetical protein
MSPRSSCKPGAWLAALLLTSAGACVSCNDLLDIPEYGPEASISGLGCDANTEHDSCGIAADGQPLTCFGARQLGGEDFCTEACDVALGSPDPERFACVGSGARLQICEPGNADGCPAGLACFRTDLSPFPGLLYPKQAAGLCIAMPVCTDHADCADQPTRRVCGGEVMREKYPELKGVLLTDHFQCVVECDGAGHGCPSGESCLSLLLDPSLPNVCVPDCESAPCPPNFFCLRDAGPAYPPICAPGLPGFRCATSEDCILGYCAATGAGFNVCTIPCKVDSQCGVLKGLRDPFLCQQGICVSKAPFAGALCRADAHCPSGQHCSEYDAYRPGTPRLTTNLECHSSCDGEGRCPRAGGMPYVCLPNGDCYPGDMGLPCTGTDECMGELTCEVLEDPSNSDRSTGLEICTKACDADAECVGYGRDPKACLDGFCRLRDP